MKRDTASLGPRDLLLTLDACVRHDLAFSGLRGMVCLGIRGPSAEMWWRVELGKEARPEFVAKPPKDADVVLLMGEEEAEALLGCRPLKARPELLELKGDRELLKRFLDRYLARRSWLDVRSSAAASAKRRVV